jgi:hypothetical protein
MSFKHAQHKKKTKLVAAAVPSSAFVGADRLLFDRVRYSIDAKLARVPILSMDFIQRVRMGLRFGSSRYVSDAMKELADVPFQSFADRTFEYFIENNGHTFFFTWEGIVRHACNIVFVSECSSLPKFEDADPTLQDLISLAYINKSSDFVGIETLTERFKTREFHSYRGGSVGETLRLYAMDPSVRAKAQDHVNSESRFDRSYIPFLLPALQAAFCRRLREVDVGPEMRSQLFGLFLEYITQNTNRGGEVNRWHRWSQFRYSLSAYASPLGLRLAHFADKCREASGRPGALNYLSRITDIFYDMLVVVARMLLVNFSNFSRDFRDVGNKMKADQMQLVNEIMYLTYAIATASGHGPAFLSQQKTDESASPQRKSRTFKGVAEALVTTPPEIESGPLRSHWHNMTDIPDHIAKAVLSRSLYEHVLRTDKKIVWVLVHGVRATKLRYWLGDRYDFVYHVSDATIEEVAWGSLVGLVGWSNDALSSFHVTTLFGLAMTHYSTYIQGSHPPGTLFPSYAHAASMFCSISPTNNAPVRHILDTLDSNEESLLTTQLDSYTTRLVSMLRVLLALMAEDGGQRLPVTEVVAYFRRCPLWYAAGSTRYFTLSPQDTQEFLEKWTAAATDEGRALIESFFSTMQPIWAKMAPNSTAPYEIPHACVDDIVFNWWKWMRVVPEYLQKGREMSDSHAEALDAAIEFVVFLMSKLGTMMGRMNLKRRRSQASKSKRNLPDSWRDGQSNLKTSTTEAAAMAAEIVAEVSAGAAEAIFAFEQRPMSPSNGAGMFEGMNRTLVRPTKLCLLQFMFHYERQCHEFSDYQQKSQEPHDCVVLDNIGDVATALHGRLLLVPQHSVAIPVHAPHMTGPVSSRVFTESALYDYLLNRNVDLTKVNLMLHVLAITTDGVSDTVRDLGSLLKHPLRNPFPPRDLEQLTVDMEYKKAQESRSEEEEPEETVEPAAKKPRPADTSDGKDADDDGDAVMANPTSPASPTWDQFSSDDEEEDDCEWEKAITVKTVPPPEQATSIFDEPDTRTPEEIAQFNKEMEDEEHRMEEERRQERIREMRRSRPKKPPPKAPRLSDLTPRQQERVRRGELVPAPAFTMTGMVNAAPPPKKMYINNESLDESILRPAPINDEADNSKPRTRGRRSAKAIAAARSMRGTRATPRQTTLPF